MGNGTVPWLRDGERTGTAPQYCSSISRAGFQYVAATRSASYCSAKSRARVRNRTSPRFLYAHSSPSTRFLIRGVCHQAMSESTHTGWHSAFHPAPHNSVCAELLPTITGVPHACASMIGKPNPSP